MIKTLPPFSHTLALLAACVVSLPALTASAQTIQPQNEHGIGQANLNLADLRLTDHATPVGRSVLLETSHVEDGDRKYSFTKLEPQAFDAVEPGQPETMPQAWTLEQNGAAIRVEHTDLPDNRLDLKVTLKAPTDATLADFTLDLLRLPNANDAINLDKPRVEQSLDNVAIVPLQAGEDSVLWAISETVTPPLKLGWVKQGDMVTLRLSGGVMMPEPGAYRIYPHGLPRVDPGQSLTLNLSLRWSDRGKTQADVAPDVLKSFRELHGGALDWDDRRPIGMIMLSSGYHASETNPRGWFNEPKIDITTEEGRADFRKRAMAFADRSVKVMNEVGGQGSIVWDIEGQENPHPVSFIGDPRLTKEFAPEMDAIADEFFKRLSDNGQLATGICIRPSQVYYNQEKKAWAHNAGNDGLPNRGGSHFPDQQPEDLASWKYFPIVERLSAKISYAQERWGCTIFYIDTNGNFRPVGEDQQFKWQLMPAHMLAALRQRHPDVLIVPELVKGDGAYHAAYWGHAAPYFELDLGGLQTPSHIQQLFPNAFSVLNISDGDFEKHRSTLADSIRRGDVILFHGWWMSKRNQQLKALLNEARQK